MTILGIDCFLQDRAASWRHRRAGLVANLASQTGGLVPTIDALHAHPDVKLVALFGPEHGVRGAAQAGETVDSATDCNTGLPVHSLYGAHRRPTAAMLAGLEVIFFDLQDAGARFFTYISTLSLVMAAAAEHHLPAVVFDRPNPITGCRVEGNVLDPAFTSFVGCCPMALRHGMTVGEMARWFNHAQGIGCSLEVISMRGWRREMWHDQTGCTLVPPAPNIPTLDTLAVYPGTCLVEGTNISEGRGTTRPFELIGAPWIDEQRLWQDLRALDLPGVAWRQACFRPTFDKYQGQLCRGVQLHVVDRRIFEPVRTALHLISAVRSRFADDFRWVRQSVAGPWFFDLLMGTDRVRLLIDEGRAVEAVCAEFQPGLQAFERERASFLLYPS